MNKIKNQKKCWDELAEEKEFPTPFKMEEFKKHTSQGTKILDVGCGYGRILNELHNNSFKNLTGVDFSEKMIKRGSELYPYLKLVKNNGKKLPFPDDEFDAVILVGVLTSNFQTEEQKNLIREITRVLTTRGVLYISDFLLNNDQRNLERYQKYEDEYGIYGVFELPEGLTLRHHTIKHISKLTEEYEELIFEKTVFKTMNGNISNSFYYMGRKK
ncbi:MAG: ubiquinone/menaquinone biosynthesis methyltransferase [Methanobacterium sp. PtaB.Bin024]|jgi:ubiquinone/menaquinone biosynthesis C-methylase UbiE|nr:MAG: ubiquinone/menaquinone biosynthesis methyltransferase [Methanobacterium sp. PtaB.Bin024]